MFTTRVEIYAEYEFRAHRYTGKERDAESGLDNFGARYYASNMGRFMGPDFNDSPDPVPYADFTNPQSLNLYSYAYNNPLTNMDADGHVGTSDTCDTNIFCKLGSFVKSLFSGGGANSGQEAEGAFNQIGNTFQAGGNFLDRELNNGRNQQPLTPIVGASQQRGAALAAMGMFFIPGPDEAEGASLASKWGPGTFDNLETSLSYHFEKHGSEVGASDLLQYLRKADQFAANLERSKKIPLPDGATRYIKGGRYIIKNIEGKILSFGSVGEE
jgi:RHS repeat-associated protein